MFTSRRTTPPTNDLSRTTTRITGRNAQNEQIVVSIRSERTNGEGYRIIETRTGDVYRLVKQY